MEMRNAPPPKLWNQRLGLVRAGNLWKRQGRSIWWQGWSDDGDAYLILPDQLLAADTKNLRKHQVLGLTLLGSDELHRQQLIQRLQRQSERPAKPSSLQRRCMQRLAEAPAVFWTSDALAAMSGTTAPLLQQGRHGCLGLQLRGNTLHWSGYIGDRSIALAASQPKNGWNFSTSDRHKRPNVDNVNLLEVHGARVDLILGSLSESPDHSRTLGISVRSQSSNALKACAFPVFSASTTTSQRCLPGWTSNSNTLARRTCGLGRSS